MIDLDKLKEPGKFSRCAPFWSWNDKLNKEELLRQIDEMHEKGYGGFFMHSRVGLVTEYLSDEWMQLIYACVERAKELDMLAWLYDEDKWPSGFAGGIVPLKDKRYRHKFLALLKKEALHAEDEIFESFLYDGDEYFIVKRTMQLGDRWFNGACYVDLLSKEAVLEFIKVTHEEYKKVCGNHFGGAVPGIFTDEPMYLREHYKDIPTLPWTDDFASVFLEEKGYDIKDHLKELFFNIGDFEKVRFDFFDVATKLFIENFTKTYASWCEENGIDMTGHFMAEDTLRGQVEWIGAAMPHYEYMQLPGIDKLARHLEQTITVKQVSSVAEQLGKKGVLCETFGTTGQHVSFLHRKWISDWQAILGVTYINPHLSLYSMRGERKRDYPPNLFYQQPWWEDERQFSDYLARLCFLASLGKRDVDVLLLHPISSAWALYSKFDDSIDKLDKLFDMIAKELISQKIDFHLGDEIILKNHAKVSNGKISIGDFSYSVVIIPPSINIRKSTEKILERFLESGGRVILLDDFLYKRFRLERIDGAKNDVPFLSSVDVAHDLDEMIGMLKSQKELIEITDKRTGKNAKSVIMQKRDIDDKTSLIMIANTDLKREANVSIKIPYDKNVYVLDPVECEIFNIPGLKRLHGAVFIDATLYPASSLFLLLSDDEKKLDHKNVIKTGVVFEKGFDFVKKVDVLDVELNDLNILMLDRVKYEVEGKVIFEDALVSNIWHNYFYNLEEGTRFRASYEFFIDHKPDKLFAVIECAENLDRIIINQTYLRYERAFDHFDKAQNFLDVNFAKIDITSYVKEGKNQIIIEGRKSNNITTIACHQRVKNPKDHRPTEVEAIYILGDFSLIDVDETRYVITYAKKPHFDDITKDGYPFYTGSITLKGMVDINKTDDARYYLKLNQLQAACAKVYANEEFCGTFFCEPFLIDITDSLKNGENMIKVTLTNTLFNIIEASHNKDIFDETFRRPQSFVNLDVQTDKYMLMPFGLGSISILSKKI